MIARTVPVIVIYILLRCIIMNNSCFKKIIAESLKPFGFKKAKSNFLLKKGCEVTFKLHLQRSVYSAVYYIRCYYVINNMPLDYSDWGMTGHTSIELELNSQKEQQLAQMCDLANDVPDELRASMLKSILNETFKNYHFIETEEELREMILKRLLPEFKVVLEYLKIDQERYDQMWQEKRDARRMQRMAQIFEVSPSGDYELCNKEKCIRLTYYPNNQEVLIRINMFINPYTQHVEKVYQEKLDKLKYFTKVVPYENPMQEVEKIDADKANKLGFMHVELTIFDYVVDGDGIEKVKEAIFQMQEEQAPHESYVCFKSDYNGNTCYFEYGEWTFKRAVIKGENGYHGFVLSEGNQGLLRQLNGDFVRLESADSFELISHTAFQDIWDKTE